MPIETRIFVKGRVDPYVFSGTAEILNEWVHVRDAAVFTSIPCGEVLLIQQIAIPESEKKK